MSQIGSLSRSYQATAYDLDSEGKVVSTSSVDQSQTSTSFSQYSVKGNHLTPNPYEYDSYRSNPLQGTFNRYSPWAGYGSFKCVGEHGATPVFYPPDASWTRSNTENAAIQALYENIRGGLDLIVDLAEVGKTLQTIQKPLHGIASIVESVTSRNPTLAKAKRGNRQSYRRDLSNAPDVHTRSQAFMDGTSSAWLEAQFSVKPLLYSIYDTLGNLNDRNSPIGPGYPVKGSRQDKTRHKSLREVNFTSGIGILDVECNYDVYVTARAFLKLAPAVKARQLQSYASMNPYSIGWELTPASWLVDYLWDVSGYIRSHESAHTYHRYIDSAAVSNLRVARTLMQHGPRGNAGGYPTQSDVSGFASGSHFKRTMPTLLIPSRPVSKSPNELGFNQIGNIISFIAQRLL